MRGVNPSRRSASSERKSSDAEDQLLASSDMSQQSPVSCTFYLYLHQGHAGLLDLSAHDLKQVCKVVCVRACLCAATGCACVCG